MYEMMMIEKYFDENSTRHQNDKIYETFNVINHDNEIEKYKKYVLFLRT